jgi:protein-disulfide isomerase
VASALPDSASGTVTISGANFGSRPFVTLDLVPLDIRVALDTVILAAVPAGTIPHGEYLLTVSRGPAPEDNGTVEVIVGAAEPASARADGGQRSTREAGPPEPTNRDMAALPPLVAGDVTAVKIGDRAVSVDEIDREWRRSDPAGYLRLIRRLHDARQQNVNRIITQELLAREAETRGIDVEALLAEELPKRATPMPESAVVSLYQSLGTGTRGTTLDQMRPALRAWLARHTEPELAKTSFVEELKKVSTRVEVLLEAPRVQIERTAHDIALGPDTALVDIVVFGDFQSPEYTRLARGFSKVRDTFGDRVRFVFKTGPPLGTASIAAAEAAFCANAQNRFWPYHDALVGAAGVGVKESDATAGLDSTAFSSCVEHRDFRDTVRKAIVEADGYGIEAIPSVMVNGRLAPSPPPFLAAYEYFKLLIEEELARVAAARRR